MFHFVLASLSCGQNLQPNDGPNSACLQDWFFELLRVSDWDGLLQQLKKLIKSASNFYFVIISQSMAQIGGCFDPFIYKWLVNIIRYFVIKICKPRTSFYPRLNFKKTSKEYFHVSCPVSPIFHQVLKKSDPLIIAFQNSKMHAISRKNDSSAESVIVLVITVVLKSYYPFCFQTHSFRPWFRLFKADEVQQTQTLIPRNISIDFPQ